jgi:hypothetical protein
MGGRPWLCCCNCDSFAHRWRRTAPRATTAPLSPPLSHLPNSYLQGTLNAVFEFLRDLGFRFWNAAHPNRTAMVTLPPISAAVPACDRVFEPPIEYPMFRRPISLHCPSLRTLTSATYKTLMCTSLLCVTHVASGEQHTQQGHELYVVVRRYRLFFAHAVCAGDPLWRLQNHMNGAMDGEVYPLPLEQGGGVGYVNGYFVSTLYALVPPEDHFAAHPEWYSYGCIHGNCTRRYEWKPGGPPAEAKKGNGLGCNVAQLCLSNPELRSFVVNQTLAVIAGLNETHNHEHVHPSIISVSQNDCSEGSRCQCSKCLAMEQAQVLAGDVQHVARQCPA